MKKGLFAALAVWVGCAGWVPAQQASSSIIRSANRRTQFHSEPERVTIQESGRTYTLTDPPQLVAPGPPDLDIHGEAAVEAGSPACGPGSRPCFGLRLEALAWWIKDGPLPVPLVTQGDPVDPLPGHLGQLGTRVLFGGQDLDYDTFFGGRVTFGAWLNSACNVGFEAGGFWLEQHTLSFDAVSNGSGSPILAFPYFDLEPGFEGEQIVIISDFVDPDFLRTGFVSIRTSSELWGAEASGVFQLRTGPFVEIDMLAGLRYLDLTEDLSMFNITTSFTPPDDPLLENTVTDNHTDLFDTRNQFYGMQLGVRLRGCFGSTIVELLGKAALGTTHQLVETRGVITQTGPGAFAPGTHVGGVFVQPTNIGRRTDDEITIVPEFRAQASWGVCDHLRVFVNYNLIWWSSVVRPGEQIDRRLNLSQNAVYSSGAEVLIGPPAPWPIMTRTEFWAQGLGVGFEVNY